MTVICAFGGVQSNLIGYFVARLTEGLQGAAREGRAWGRSKTCPTSSSLVNRSGGPLRLPTWMRKSSAGTEACRYEALWLSLPGRAVDGIQSNL